jgi:alpha-tubulin suppressor-like RCC1 family protein
MRINSSIKCYWLKLGCSALLFNFFLTGKSDTGAVPVSGPIGVTANPSFTPNVPSSAAGDTFYHYLWSAPASGIAQNEINEPGVTPPQVGYSGVTLGAETSEETIQNNNDVVRGTFQADVYHMTYLCGPPNCWDEGWSYSLGAILNGDRTETTDSTCFGMCGGVNIPCSDATPWYPFSEEYRIPCNSLASTTYQATNLDGSLQWQIIFTYATNNCWFSQQAYIPCDNYAYQPWVTGQSAYFEVAVWMQQGIVPPSLASLGMYSYGNLNSAGALTPVGGGQTPSFHLFPAFVSFGDSGSSGSAQFQQPPAQPQTPMYAANGPIGSRISAGFNFALFVKEDGSAWSWGDNSYGQLGTPAVFGQTTNAVQVTGAPIVAQVSAGNSHALALARNGSVWAWGRDESGEVGLALNLNGVPYTPATVTNPIPVLTPKVQGGLTPLVGASSVAASFYGVDSYAVLTNGTVVAWGNNGYGQLGFGTLGGQSPVAMPIPNLTGVVSVAAGSLHALALTTNGTVYGWGDNSYGQLGNGSSGAKVAIPTLMTTLTNSFIVAIAAGNGTSFAIDSSGNVWACGLNGVGQLGIGSTNNTATATLVAGLGSTNAIIGIAAGYHHCLAIGFDGSYWSWGLNALGQLGDGTTKQSLVPEHLGFSGGLTSIGIAAGTDASFSVQSDLSLLSWGCSGFGKFGQLGRVISGIASPTQGQVNSF